MYSQCILCMGIYYAAWLGYTCELYKKGVSFLSAFRNPPTPFPFPTCVSHLRTCVSLLPFLFTLMCPIFLYSPTCVSHLRTCVSLLLHITYVSYLPLPSPCLCPIFNFLTHLCVPSSLPFPNYVPFSLPFF